MSTNNDPTPKDRRTAFEEEASAKKSGLLAE